MISTVEAASASLTGRGNTLKPAVLEIDPLGDPRWAELVSSSDQASVYHGVQWLQALFSTYGYRPVALTTSGPSDSRLVSGLVFCEIKSPLTGHRLVSLPFSDQCDVLADTPDEAHALMDNFFSRADGKQWKSAELRSISQQFGEPASPEETYKFHSIDLRPTENDLFRRMHKDCIQRKIRRAEREGVSVRSGHDLLGDFYRLMIMTRRSKGLPPQPRRWFRSLCELFGTNLEIQVAYKSEHPIAAMLTLRHMDSLTYKYGASDARFHNLGAMPLLFWRTIQNAKTMGVTLLDLGRSDLDDPGLSTFKERLGANARPGHYTIHPRRSKKRPKWAQSAAKRVLEATPDRALEAIGTLLYPHVG